MDGSPSGVVIVVFNLPVPDDHRVWAQACALRDAGLRVTVVCPAIRDAPPGSRRIDGIDVHCFRSFEGEGRAATVIEGAWTTYAAARAARKALARLGGPRALQVCNPPDLSFRLLRRARRRGVLTVYDQHDVVSLLAAARPSFRRLVPFFLACERRTVEAADVVLTPSDEQAARLRTLYDRDAVVVRTAAVSPSDDAPSPSHEPTVLGYLGVIGEQDGVVELVDAVQALRAAGRADFRVEIAGDGPALPSVRVRVAELGLDDTIRLHGWLGRDRVDAFLSSIDAMVVPDPESEFNHHCAMNKVTHAMARGIPVVLRPLRENARLVGKDGFVASDMSLPAFVESIADLLDATPEDRATAGSRLRATFDAELTWDISGPRYLAVFQAGRA